MKILRNPACILGIISVIVGFFGVGIKVYGFGSGNYVIIAAVILAGIHWIWSIADVASRKDMKPFQRRFWLIAVIAAPAIGALLFYTMHQKAGKITT